MKRYNKLSEPDSNGDLKQTVTVTRDTAEYQKAAPEIAEMLANEQAARRETEIVRDANIALTQDLSLHKVLETILLTIKDDGGGFDAENVNAPSFPVNLGLRGMEERALALGGRLEIKSAPSRGTEICAYFPNED